MQIAVFFMRVLEVMFFLGLAGSTVVVIISFIEAARELFGEDYIVFRSLSPDLIISIDSLAFQK